MSISQLMNFFRPAQFRRRKASPVIPEKDWPGITARLEKRVNLLEAEGRSLQEQCKDKERQTQEQRVAVAGLKQQLEQGDAWRIKEGAVAVKEKARERVLQEELHKTRDALNSELSGRIKREAELKDLRRVKEEIAGTGRGLASRVAELERQLESALKELNQLRAGNSQLRKKNEGAEWVAKADYKQLEGQLKNARREIEGLKTGSAVLPVDKP